MNIKTSASTSDINEFLINVQFTLMAGCTLYHIHVIARRFLELYRSYWWPIAAPQKRQPEYLRQDAFDHYSIDGSVKAVEKKLLPSLCSSTNTDIEIESHDDANEFDENIPLPVKKERILESTRSSSRRRDAEETCYAPDMDCWGAPRQRRRKNRMHEYVSYAAVWYILSRVMRRKTKL